MTYQVKLEVFEGPLDLLLHLIRKDEMDIYDIPIYEITSGYLEYIKMMRKFNLEVAGEFLIMAATLIYIKSRSLLPELSAEEEVEEFKEELTARLLEYKKFKGVQGYFKEKEKVGQNIFTREKTQFEGDQEIDLTLFNLVDAFKSLLAKKKEYTREMFNAPR